MNPHAATLVAYLEGIGLRGPGLDGWEASLDVLAGAAPHVPAHTTLVAPVALPPAERRRVGKGVKIALDAGFAATLHAGRDAATLASIFASSSGDGDNCDAICRELAGDRMISPTRFHNSVHNAPSGYWGIASGSMHPSTSLCAYDDSFVAGLDDAMTQLACGLDAVLLVAYDAPYPDPLNAARPTSDCFAVGLVLTRERSERSIARLAVLPASARPASRAGGTPEASGTLEAVRSGIPAARALPLLSAVATALRASDSRSGEAEVVVIEGQDGGGTALAVERIASIPATPALSMPSRSAACG